MGLYGRINTQLGVCDRYVRSEEGARIMETMGLYGRINTQLGVCDRYVRSEAGARIKSAGIASIINSLRIYNTVNS
jgi:hypothetical protein